MRCGPRLQPCTSRPQWCCVRLEVFVDACTCPCQDGALTMSTLCTMHFPALMSVMLRGIGYSRAPYTRGFPLQHSHQSAQQCSGTLTTSPAAMLLTLLQSAAAPQLSSPGGASHQVTDHGKEAGSTRWWGTMQHICSCSQHAKATTHPGPLQKYSVSLARVRCLPPFAIWSAVNAFPGTTW